MSWLSRVRRRLCPTCVDDAGNGRLELQRLRRISARLDMLIDTAAAIRREMANDDNPVLLKRPRREAQ